MNSKRSYLDTLNAGRQRRPHTTLEQLNRSLETLEQRLGRSLERPDEPARGGSDERLRVPSARPDASRSQQPLEERHSGWQRSQGASAYDQQPYQSIARDIDRVRGQESGMAAFGKVADELKALREDLRQQVTSGIRREFDILRKDLERANSSGAPDKITAQLGLEFDRISSAIRNLSERSDDKSINMLRLDLEQVKSALDTLAREETVLSVDRRWDDFDRRWTDFEDRVDARQQAYDPGIAALTDRLEQINAAVNNLPESLSLRSLEEKVRTLAGAVDHFARQQEHGATDTYGLIEERLDEISRAIVASTAAAQAPTFDTEPFERIEARISALARQIEEVVEDRPSSAVLDRLALLSQRVDEIAADANLPDQQMERLATQIAAIADRIDRAPAAPDADYIFQGIEQRFDVFSTMIERRQGDALEQGNMLFRDLERRLDEVADRLDQQRPEAGFDNSAVMDAIDQRFTALADRIGNAPQEAQNEAMRALEARLESISTRLDSSAAQFAGIDPKLIRSLEAQVTGLSEHLSRPGTPLPEFEDIGPRLDDIEKSIEGSRDTILEAARQAAENAVRSLDGSASQTAAVSGLAQDLKVLETLTRRSDERNSKTFEAIHDTLIKIVDRLGSLETSGSEDETAGQPAPPRIMSLPDAPSIDFDETLSLTGDMTDTDTRTEMVRREPSGRTPAEAAAAAAIAALGSDDADKAEPVSPSRSMLGGLSRVFSKKNKEQPVVATESVTAPAFEAPSIGLDEPLDPKLANRPLEPGSGAPDLAAIMKRVRDERGQTPKGAEPDAAKSDFIAAARRAAQAAAAEAEIMKRKSEISGPVRALRIGDLLKARRKTVLMATATIMLALAGLQLGKAFMADSDEMAAVEPASLLAQQVETASLEPAAEAAGGSVDPAEQAEAVRSVEPETPKAATAPEEITIPAAEPEEMASAAAAQPAGDTVHSIPDGPVTAATESLLATDPLSKDSEPAPALPKIEVPLEAGPVALREAAEAGDAKALFEIGARYAEGRGVKTDNAQAAQWYEKSAELGFAPAQYRIGNFYEKAIGVERDIQKSKTWYQLAAAQGNASAMHNLAVLFAMGADGTADNESAARWFTDAAELGVKDSQFNLGILAAKGVGVEQSLEDSYKWFALVAKTGDRDAAAKRDEVANSLRPEQLERARAAAELWKPKPLDPQSNSAEIPASWQESTTTTASVDMKKAVRNIQAILNKNGYEAGEPDGVMGDKTKSAIIAFQKDNDMEESGKVDEKLVRALLARK